MMNPLEEPEEEAARYVLAALRMLSNLTDQHTGEILLEGQAPPTSVQRRVGRPTFDIPVEQLQYLVDTVPQMSQLIRRTGYMSMESLLGLLIPI